MSKIAEALVVVEQVQSEIDDLRSERDRLRLEAIQLDGSADPDDISRRAALLEAMQQVDSKIPAARYAPGQDRPALGWRLLRAEEALEVVRRQRHNLVRQLEELRSLADKWGPHLDDLGQAFGSEARVFRVTGFPNDDFQRSWRSRSAWLARLKSEIGSIPVLEKRLAEYGPDLLGDYVDRSVLSDQDLSFRRSQKQERADSLRLRALELEQAQVQRRLGV